MATYFTGDSEKSLESLEVKPPAPQENAQYLSGGRLAVVFTGFLLSILLTTMDQTIVSTSLPRIVSDFNSLGQATWVATAYFLTQGGFILIIGQILVLASKKRTLLVSIALFELGSLLCAVSRSLPVLIFGRAVAGCGASGIQMSVTTAIPEVAALELRPILFAFFGAILGISSVVGPILGGVLTDKASWRWCFWINLPLGGIAFLIVLIFLRIPPKGQEATASSMKKKNLWFRLDWVGAILGLGFVTSLLLPLQWGGNSKPWSSPVVIALFVVFGVLLVLFGLWETYKGPNAMLPMTMLIMPTQLGCFFSGFFGYMSLFIATYYLPLWYQAHGSSATSSGIKILPFLISVVISAGISGAVVTKTGRYWWILVLCPLLTSIGSGLLFTITDSTSLKTLIGFQILYGVGIGTVFQNILIAIQAEYSDREELIPQATSLVSFGQLLGGVVGLAIAGSIFNNRLRDNFEVIDLPVVLKLAVEQSVTVIAALPIETRNLVTAVYVKSLDPVFLLGVPAGILSSLSALAIKNHNLKERSGVAPMVISG
jgi:MFS family permease